MSDLSNKDNNEHPYGSGVFRRRIKINCRNSSVEVLLEDDNHGFQLCLNHDGNAVTGIDVNPIRYPYDTCPAAIDKLTALVGQPLSALEELSSVTKARLHCTHLFDLLQLAIDYSGQSDTDHQYDIVIPDEIDGLQKGSISLDGEIIHDWLASNNMLVAPPNLKGQPLMRGFYAWAQELIPDHQRRAAEALQRGFIVSTSRRVDMENFADQPVNTQIMPVGACHSMQPGIVEGAQRNRGVVRDFTDTEELLLKFQ
jgi:hypothetical protein